MIYEWCEEFFLCNRFCTHPPLDKNIPTLLWSFLTINNSGYGKCRVLKTNYNFILDHLA